jgi:hypothetical protein
MAKLNDDQRRAPQSVQDDVRAGMMYWLCSLQMPEARRGSLSMSI